MECSQKLDNQSDNEIHARVGAFRQLNWYWGQAQTSQLINLPDHKLK